MPERDQQYFLRLFKEDIQRKLKKEALSAIDASLDAIVKQAADDLAITLSTHIDPFKHGVVLNLIVDKNKGNG